MIFEEVVLEFSFTIDLEMIQSISQSNNQTMVDTFGGQSSHFGMYLIFFVCLLIEIW